MSVDRSSFSTALMHELQGNMDNSHGSENWDPDRFGMYQPPLSSAVVLKPDEVLSRIEDSIEELAVVYDLLADEASKLILVKVLAYRLMGPQKVKLPLSTTAYWEQREGLRSLIIGSEAIKISFPDLTLNYMRLEKIGYPIEFYFAPVGVMATFILKQYEYGKCKPNVKAQEGDYVIDGGGCWGDTALYFAHEVGPRGKVFTFEFAPENLEIFERNVKLNPQLSQRIEVVQRALWDSSGQVIHYAPYGPATSVVHSQQDADSLQVTTLSIDDFVSESKLPRVDFIKMDIEGAELKALKGAERTLRSFGPRLAISVYHRDRDFMDIPNYLESLGLGYRFFLDHFTIYGEETILFAQTFR